MSEEPRKPRGRPATGVGVPVQIRLHEPLLSAIDYETQRLAGETGRRVSRAMAIRSILSGYFAHGPVEPDAEEDEAVMAGAGLVEGYQGDPRVMLESLRRYLLQNEQFLVGSGVTVDARKERLFVQMIVASVAALYRLDEAYASGSSLLSALGGLLSSEFRKRVLLDALERHGWHFGSVSDELRLGGSGNVSTQIRGLDLAPVLREAQSRGLAVPGGRPRRF